jgi:hypothetical protein
MSREKIANKLECILEDLEDLKDKIKDIEMWSINEVIDESLALRRFINEYIINELVLIRGEMDE